MNKRKKYYIFMFIFFCLNLNNVYGKGCEYKDQINKCVEANKNGTFKSIEEFVCINGNYDKIGYQVILDIEFKKIDNKMDQYLEVLENEKNAYFGQGSKKNYIDGVNDIHFMGDNFRRQYLNICNIEIVKKAAACGINKKTSNKESLLASGIKGTLCQKLVETKIGIYNDVAFSILMLNKEQISNDDKKKYDQGQRSNYDNLLDIMMINLGYIERIWQKWPSKLANPYK